MTIRRAGSAAREKVRPERPRILVYASVLVTGAVTLALELITSRVLTPFVGGGLIVWTAILSVTLLALAIGYHLGSKWSVNARRRFVVMPAAAAAVLCVTAMLYPDVLPRLTGGSAITGAFIGAGLVLAPALVLLSAMGPLGIALLRTAEGDSGAGEVFAVSTVGSILGVFLAAFGLIPFMAPPVTLLFLATALTLVGIAAALRFGGSARAVALLLLGGAAAVFVAEGALSDRETIRLGRYRLAHVATERSPHATIVVADLSRVGAQGRVRLYLEENQVQSARGFGLPGRPLGYIAITEAILQRTVPEGGRVLLAGLAGGTLASDLADAGFSVDAVEINPRSVTVARRWFDLHPSVTVTVADARRAVQQCTAPYDAAFIDVFNGLEIPSHLTTREFFVAVSDCLDEDSVIVLNTVVPNLQARPTRRLLAALASASQSPVAVYDIEPGDAARRNRVLVARLDRAPAPILRLPDYPTSFLSRDQATFKPQIVRADDLSDVKPLTDESNDFALALALTTPWTRGIPIPIGWY